MVTGHRTGCTFDSAPKISLACCNKKCGTAVNFDQSIAWMGQQNPVESGYMYVYGGIPRPSGKWKGGAGRTQVGWTKKYISGGGGSGG